MGTSNKAADAANAADAQRQAQIQQAITQINTAYGSPQRTGQYQQYGQNLQKYYTGQVNEQQKVNAQNLKFAIARSGLTGGSASKDATTQLNKDYTKGLLQASQQAQAGQAALEQSDVNAKNQLVSLAQSGNYVGAIPQQTAQAQSASLDAAKGYTNANALGDLFAGTAQIYKNQETAAANRRAQVSPIGSYYGGNSTGSVYG